jgi:hypothetical protein
VLRWWPKTWKRRAVTAAAAAVAPLKSEERQVFVKDFVGTRLLEAPFGSTWCNCTPSFFVDCFYFGIECLFAVSAVKLVVETMVVVVVVGQVGVIFLAKRGATTLARRAITLARRVAGILVKRGAVAAPALALQELDAPLDWRQMHFAVERTVLLFHAVDQLIYV